NLYPFEETVARPDCDLETAIENIDIGGPTMLRAAAKNHRHVSALADTADYGRVLDELRAQGGISAATRFDLALKAFEHTARYDGAIANWLGRQAEAGVQTPFPRTFNLQLRRRGSLRYGENPHQAAAFYVEANQQEASVAAAQQLQGKELSFNNIAD